MAAITRPARTRTSYPELRREACCTCAVGKSRIALRLVPKPCVVTPQSVWVCPTKVLEIGKVCPGVPKKDPVMEHKGNISTRNRKGKRPDSQPWS